jgi:uncharacterized protein YegJ (DUF2314 family)
MGFYKRGDNVKVKFHFKQSGESEWLWLIVTYSDDKQQFVFGYLDSEPRVNTNMRFGMEMIINYDNIKDHIEASDLVSSCP